MRKKTGQNSGGNLWIYGRHAVAAAVGNLRREILKVLCTKETAGEIKPLLEKARRNAEIMKITDRREIEKNLPSDAVHQGFAALVKPLENILLEDICSLAEVKNECRVLMLDQVTDPQNVGAIIRSCAAFGADALIVQDKNSPEESGAMVKASAGTIELLPVCRVTNLSRALEMLKKKEFWIVGLDGYARKDINDMSRAAKTVVVMGSEGKGMRRLVEESCDETVRLPISSKVESLNVSTAAAIALYELGRR